jgi:hypothetical protein
MNSSSRNSKFLLNRSPSSILLNKTPYEKYLKVLPNPCDHYLIGIPKGNLQVFRWFISWDSLGFLKVLPGTSILLENR